MTQSQSQIRVLHVFARMDRGGAETWILNVLREIDRDEYQFDFLVQPGSDGVYDEEIRRLGGRIIHGPSPSHPVSFAVGMYKVLKRLGPYNVVHSHVHHFSGLTLSLARIAGVPVRIAHSHNDLRRQMQETNLYRRVYERVMKLGIWTFATVGLAASRDAAVSLFGEGWSADNRFRVLHCGIDLSVFSEHPDRLSIRSELGIPDDAFVLGHVGSFSAQKNHVFLLEVFRQVHEARPEAMLLLLGDGPLMHDVESHVDELGLTHHVRFLGSRPDVGQILQGAMDLFLFPSHYEGLGMALVEAQAAGLPCVISDTIPAEADVVPDLVQRLSLMDDLTVWATTVIAHTASMNRTKALCTVEASDFNIRISSGRMARIYTGCADINE